ncbi:MAG: aldehyde dehydrogenase family protein, partial [Gemmatimonadales bacterium]
MPETFETLLAGPRTVAGRVTVEAPWDRSPIAEVETTGAAGVEQALATAHGLFRDRSGWLSVPRRIEILERAAAMVQDQADVLALEAAREGGKPLLDSQVEVARAVDSLRLCVDFLRTDAGEPVPMGLNAASAGRRTLMMTEPIGVVVAVSAFNHPLNLIAHQVGPAIAAGCPVIVKPAEDTPLSCWRLVRILHEAGLPAEWCQAVLTDSHETAEALVTDERVAFLSFIGSAKVGWMLRSKLAPGTRCALEHGGVAPVIVAADADLDLAVPKLLKGGFYHAGQVCVSVQRVLAARKIAVDLTARLAEGAAKLRIGDPTLADTEVGPLIRPVEVERVQEWVQEAVDGGGTVRSGGRVHSPTTYQST